MILPLFFLPEQAEYVVFDNSKHVIVADTNVVAVETEVEVVEETKKNFGSLSNIKSVFLNFVDFQRKRGK